MVTKTVRYIDPLTKEERVEKLYFHLTAAEVFEMGLDRTSVAGEMIGRLRERAEQAEKEGINVEELAEEFSDNDVSALYQVIKTFVINGYGEISPNGKHLKSSQRREEFVASEAFSKLILELCSDAEKGSSFINGMMPDDLREQAAKLAAVQTPEAPKAELTVVEDRRKVTRKELIEMSPEEFTAVNNEISAGRIELVDDDLTPVITS